MTGDMGTYVVFLLGVLVGGIIANKDFRYKFFKGLRKFLAQLSSGARNYSERYSEGRDRQTREPTRARAQTREAPEVQHIYKQVHTRKECSTCEGSGRVYEKASKLQEGAPGFKPTAIDCPDCDGEGQIWN